MLFNKLSFHRLSSGNKILLKLSLLFQFVFIICLCTSVMLLEDSIFDPLGFILVRDIVHRKGAAVWYHCVRLAFIRPIQFFTDMASLACFHQSIMLGKYKE